MNSPNRLPKGANPKARISVKTSTASWLITGAPTTNLFCGYKPKKVRVAPNMQHQTEYSFMASLQSLNEQAHIAKFYIMNTSRNRNRWGVTTQALSDALPTLKGVKIGMGQGYKIDKHYPDDQTIDSGAIIDYENPGSYAVGTAKIEDPQTWTKMKAHELGPVSVVISCFRDVCSECGADLTAIEDPTGTHKCLRDGDAYSRVESFRFKRVDFVD